MGFNDSTIRECRKLEFSEMDPNCFSSCSCFSWRDG